MILINLLLRIILFSLAVVAAVLCLHVDVNILKDGLSETSFTEIVQESILLIIVLVHLIRARKDSTMRQCNVLIAGFFMAMLIRELDAVFDLVRHGSWVWFALLVSVVSIIYALRNPSRVAQQLIAYASTPSYGVMVSGLLTILIFSRLFGMSILWQSILQDGYARIVKNMVEEGVELFGYIVCLGASINLLGGKRSS
ncbi:hypothetical protein [Kluyvera genomosp. 1]|uniref:hypothetical protein n=1 Tax=Kluyvera genomosp. 1 TaxID=2774053 RepID=UPI000690DE31|nr:hypothetical protein [Kluyvera genomosp. 1]